MTPTKAIKATKATRRVPQEQVPAELRNLYDADKPETVSLDFSTTAAPDAEPVKLEKLFGIDGTDYMIPAEFGPSLGLIYLDRIGEGRDVTLAAVLKTVIGDDGWAALMKLAKDNKISKEQLAALLEIVNNKLMGAMEETEGN